MSIAALQDKRSEIIQLLRGYRSKVAEYEACKEVYDSLFPSGTSMISGLSTRNHSDLYGTERWANKRWEQAERMTRLLEDMREEYEKIDVLIDKVKGNQRTVLIRRYVLNQSWELIAARMNCDRTTAWRWHNKAIDNLVESCNTMQHSNRI